MKKLSKNTFAKLFATFLGASTILTPLVTIVSCQQINKTPIIKQTEKQPNKDNKKPNPGTPDPKPNPGTPDPKPNPGTPDPKPNPGTPDPKPNPGTPDPKPNPGTPDPKPNPGTPDPKPNPENPETPKPTDPFNDTKGNTITVTGSETTGYTLAGSIYIDDINTEKFNKKLDSFKNAHLDTSGLNINCFYEKTNNNTKQQSAITTREIETIAGKTYESKKITPEVLKGVLKLKKGDNIIKLNNKTADGNLINIPFESSIEKPFDITDLVKFSFSEDFKLAENPKIIVGSTATKQTSPSDHDITPYPKVHELLKLLNNEKLKDNITIKDVYITGNVKDLLPLLVEPGRIKEVNGGIKFLNVKEFKCPGPNVTEYDGGKNNAKSLPVGQLIEFHKRTDEIYDAVIKENARSVRLLNLVLENINTTTMNEEQLKFLHFKEDFFSGSILFKDSNLSKIDMKGVQGRTADITFENTILPRNMMKSLLATLILKNVTFPKEEFKNIGTFEDLPYTVPEIGDLIINGETKDSPLKDLTQEQIEKLKNDKYRPSEMPKNYTGPQEIYDRLKYIYYGESEKINGMPNPNYHGSIQKPQDTFLALISKNNSRG